MDTVYYSTFRTIEDCFYLNGEGGEGTSYTEKKKKKKGTSIETWRLLTINKYFGETAK